MKSHHEHHGPDHKPAPGADQAYQRAYAAAQPDAGHRVIQVELEAREIDWEFVHGSRTRAWGYNGQIPGPTLEGQVGDVFEIRFTNRLPQPTNIHWHGLRVPAAMDGTEMVQRSVAPGETFVYRFRLPDAGTFWYHPHSNEPVQLEMGLYGPLIVRGGDEPRLDAERVLVLDDVRLDKQGQVAPFGGIVEHHDGREGDTRLVNGKAEPVLEIAAGQIERWRIINASSARYVRLSVGGKPFKLLGTDGGLLEAPVIINEILLATADRVDIAVGPFAQGEEVSIDALQYLRKTMRKRKDERFATLRVGAPRPTAARIPDRLRRIAPLAPANASPNRTVTLGVKLSLRRMVDFVINRERHHHDKPVKAGELQVWDVVNTTLMDHPFHLHGFFFQVLAVNGKPPEWRSWEDVVNVPPRATVRIAWLPIVPEAGCIIATSLSITPRG
ncbi:MAG TPA: multicopper oxidase family protein [Gemmatimonadales bacterium]|nr:multicopper oxidase family protein [Gemmatimonadales bacterium]